MTRQGNAVLKRIRNRGENDNHRKKSSLDYTGPYTKEDLWKPQLRFREVSPEDRHALLIKYMRLCSVLFNFNDDTSKGENLGKEMKRQLLLVIVDHITTTKYWFNETICKEILNMVSINLFRDLPPTPSPDFDPEEDDPLLDLAWPHLQIVYEFLLRFIVSTYTDIKVLKKLLDKKFLINLIGLFKSEDPRERDYLKTILHRVYGKFMSFRSFIRQAVNNVFYDFVYENERHNGIAELLEILGSIINGFAVPLKSEHRRFLRKILIPLHKVKYVGQFHQQLSYCVVQFIEKDEKLGRVVINGLLRFWPVQSSSKEILFLNELDEILETVNKDEILEVLHPLFSQFQKSIASPHFQVSERALFMWNNEKVAQFTNDHLQDVLPILFPALHKNSKQHWNPTVHSLTFNVLQMFVDLDAQLFDSVKAAYEKQLAEETRRKEEKASFWKTYSKLQNGS